MKRLHWLLIVGFVTLTACESHARTLLTYDTLMTGTSSAYPATVDFSAYTPDAGATAPTNTFEGSLQISGTLSSTTIVANSFYVNAATVAAAKMLPTGTTPEFNYQFVQSTPAGSPTGVIIPVQRGPIINSDTNTLWEFIFEPGKVWDEPSSDHGYSRAAIPFSFKLKHQDCTANGVLMLLFKNDGSVSQTAMQIASETCYYLQLDLWALLKTTYTPAAIPGDMGIINDYKTEVGNRLQQKKIADLTTDYPGLGIVPANLAIGTASGNTIYGLVVNGINYVSDAHTRNGNYPYPEVLDLPLFSATKSFLAGTAMMRMQKLYPATTSQTIPTWVKPDCATSAWSGVTFSQALNMATGNYASSGNEVDENSITTFQNFFVPADHAHKISTGSCAAYLRKATPGTIWVYHTQDTYILGTALNKYLKSIPGRSTDDIYTNVVVSDIYKPLGLSPVTYVTRRTYDATAQPFFGNGLTFHHDDVARIAKFVGVDNGQIMGTSMLDATMLNAVLQRSKNGLEAPLKSNFTYVNGFWKSNFKATLSCTKDSYVPYASGFGGISVVMFPNGVVYYNFADDLAYDWTNPAKEIQKIGGGYCSK